MILRNYCAPNKKEKMRDFMIRRWMDARAQIGLHNELLPHNLDHQIRTFFSFATGLVLWNVKGIPISYARLWKCERFKHDSKFVLVSC